MSNPTLQPATRSPWIDWKPKERILADPAESEPTKPSKPGSVGFEGATSAESPEIEAEPDPAELARASTVLNRAGVRIMALEGGATIGVWSDLDGQEVRAALRTFGSDRLPVRYLDGAGIPMRYKARRVGGEPVPMNVLAEMERRQADLIVSATYECAHPWAVRDRMLNEMGWRWKGIAWGNPKAAGASSILGACRGPRPSRSQTIASAKLGSGTETSKTQKGGEPSPEVQKEPHGGAFQW